MVIAFGRLARTLKKVLEYSDARIEEAAAAALDLEKVKRELSALQLDRDRKQEEYARREREVEHKVGLERKRQEFEVASAKREAVLAVREEALQADRSRFESQMAFHEKRFAEEVGYLKEIIGDLAKRLPSLKMTADIKP